MKDLIVDVVRMKGGGPMAVCFMGIKGMQSERICKLLQKAIPSPTEAVDHDIEGNIIIFKYAGERYPAKAREAEQLKFLEALFATGSIVVEPLPFNHDLFAGFCIVGS